MDHLKRISRKTEREVILDLDSAMRYAREFASADHMTYVVWWVMSNGGGYVISPEGHPPNYRYATHHATVSV